MKGDLVDADDRTVPTAGSAVSPGEPPAPVHAAPPHVVREAIFLGWACALGDAKVTYLSGPITTGLAFVEAARTGGDVRAVLPRNLEALAATAARLRGESGSVVVDPSPLLVGGWSQADYMELWTGLIERHAGDVRFIPGWQYSLGCAREFVHARARDVRTRRVDGAELAAGAGRAMIEAAIRDLGDEGVDDSGRIAGLREGLAAALADLPRGG